MSRSQLDNRGLRFESGRTIVIAEVAQAHDGSLGTAHCFIDAIADAGADAVKFQTHIAAAESTPGEPWRVKFSKQDESRYEYWQRMEFSPEQWHGLKEHADDRGLLFLSSPFSSEAVELLTKVGVCAWKVASGELNNFAMFERMAASQLPFLISSGMSSFEEIDAAVSLVRDRGLAFSVLQCTTMYPCPADKVGLNLLSELRERYNCPVGLSDHSGTIYPGLAAATLGAELLEIHVTLSREMFGPDVVASVTTTELRQLVEGIRFVEAMHANPVSKDELAESLAGLKRTFGKSLVAAADLNAGTVLAESDVAMKKPGNGLPPQDLPKILGRKLKHSVSANRAFADDDFE